MNFEEQIVSWMVMSGDVTQVLKTGIVPALFLDPENRKAYERVLSFTALYNEPPTPEVFLREHPGFPLVENYSGSLDFLVDELYKAYRRLVVQTGIASAENALDADDFDKAISTMAAAAQAASQNGNRSGDVDVIATRYERLERYRLASTQDGLLGISTGLAFLDEATLGLQPAQLIVIAGLAKSCKTTIMMGLCRAVWGAGKVPLVVSFEMPEPELSRRLDGFWAGINPRRLQTGDLSEAEWRKLEHTFLGFDGAHPFVMVEDRASAMTISGLRAKVEQVKPDVLFIDGAYFLTDEISGETQSPTALTNISRSLKKLAMSAGVAIVITTQALPHKVGRGGMNMYSAGYTSAWAQDADVLMGTEAVVDSPGEFKVPILASRNSQPGDHRVSISWEPPEIKELEDEDDACLQSF